MQYPNNPEWAALQERIVAVGNEKMALSTVSCGKLMLSSGKLIVCDPFAGLRKSDNPYVLVQPGEYEVLVTMADVSDELDGSHMREAYASLIIDAGATEVKRRLLEPSSNGIASEKKLAAGEFFGYGVDAGTSCFADADAIASDMPDELTWYEGLFENDEDDCWFNQMDDGSHIRDGIANIRLPLTNSNNNLVLFHSGWGDGFYPVIGGYDQDNKLVAVHTDFFVVPGPEEEQQVEEQVPKKWWKFW